MGANVQFDNYYTMRDLNHDSNGTSWPLHHGENNLSNGQYHYNVLPRPVADVFPGVDKELLKQKMLEHEAVFRSQVYELHRLYRVQKDLMDEIRKKEQCSQRTNFETSSSSSPFPNQRIREDAQRRNSSSFLFTNGVCGVPPVLDHENVHGSHKGKIAQCGPILSQNCASPRNSEASESRPSKVRKMIDLQLPADEYMDADEVEQCGHGMNNGSGENTKCVLADLNEPLEPEEANCFQNGDLLTTAPDGTRNNSLGNRPNWLLSVSKPEGSKENGKSYYHTNHSDKVPFLSKPEQAVFENRHQPPGFFPSHHAKENGRFEVLDRSRYLSGFSNLEGLMAPHIPPNVPYSTLVNSWDNSWRKPSNYLNHTQMPGQMTSFLDSPGLSKSSQSSAQENGFLEAWLSRNNMPRINPGFGSETPPKNGFYHGSSSGRYKELHAGFSKPGLDYVNGGCNDRTASGSNCIDLNSKKELNLNVPDCFSNEDSVTVPPWLKAGASKTEPRRVLDHQNSVASTSCNVDAARETPSSTQKILGVPVFKAQPSEEREMKTEKKRVLFDINVACDDPEEPEIERPNGIRNMIDLNTCLMEEDEIVSGDSHTNSNSSITVNNTIKKPKRGIVIDLEAPASLDDEDEDVICLADENLPLDSSSDSSHETLARVAAEAIVDISTPALPQPLNKASASENTLHWFADIACITPDNEKEKDCVSTESDYFEEMTLKLTECTVEEYFPNPPKFESLAVDEAGPSNVTGRARRGPARRGRQRRDFQRDILPGLTSLARHEVTEDLQTFGGLMRATGHAWQSGTRRSSSRSGSGRGRKKAGMTVSPPPPTPPPVVNAPVFSSSKLEDRSLTGWGKTTRRPRRQRCPPAAAAGNPAPIPLT